VIRTARVVVTDHAFENLDLEAATARQGGAEFSAFECVGEAETAEATFGADAVLVNLAPITRAVLAGLSPGAVVIRYGTGFDNVDVAAAEELGVGVSVVAGYGTDSVADHALALLLALLRRVPFYDRAIRADGWCQPGAFGPLRGLSGLTVGLVGVGRIGLATIDRLHGFGCRVLAFDPFVDPTALGGRPVELVSLPELLRRAEAVSLHAPLDDATRGILGAPELAAMRPGALLVNTSRGGLVDETALADALEFGHLGGAALDVFEAEPLPADSRLRTLPNVVLTPHVAFFSEGSAALLQRSVADELGRFLSGAPLTGLVTGRSLVE
jgi:D-3-phosphoglycerate dehydrogenase